MTFLTNPRAAGECFWKMSWVSNNKLKDYREDFQKCLTIWIYFTRDYFNYHTNMQIQENLNVTKNLHYSSSRYLTLSYIYINMFCGKQVVDSHLYMFVKTPLFHILQSVTLFHTHLHSDAITDLFSVNITIHILKLNCEKMWHKVYIKSWMSLISYFLKLPFSIILIIDMSVLKKDL